MNSDRNDGMHRISLRELLAGRGIKALGDLGGRSGKARQRRLRIYDPEVRFISLGNRLEERRVGRGEAD